jgi:hypothetical protein
MFFYFFDTPDVRGLGVAGERGADACWRISVWPASDVSGYLEGIHDQYGSPAGLSIEEAKSIRDEALGTLSRCHVTFRLYASSTGPASGGFYRICTAQTNLWRAFRVPSIECPHVSKAKIEADRENFR